MVGLNFHSLLRIRRRDVAMWQSRIRFRTSHCRSGFVPIIGGVSDLGTDTQSKLQPTVSRWGFIYALPVSTRHAGLTRVDLTPVITGNPNDMFSGYCCCDIELCFLCLLQS
jgi:hypothetical protein